MRHLVAMSIGVAVEASAPAVRVVAAAAFPRWVAPVLERCCPGEALSRPPSHQKAPNSGSGESSGGVSQGDAGVLWTENGSEDGKTGGAQARAVKRLAGICDQYAA